MYDDEQDEKWPVKVFREDAEWDKTGERVRWFMLAAHTLNRLYVCTYDVDGHPSESHPQVKWIREQHPNCVLVY